jgi:tetratricopeptide (TPR) repeat protein
MNPRISLYFILILLSITACKRESPVDKEKEHALVLRDSLSTLVRKVMSSGKDSATQIDAQRVWDDAQIIAAHTKGDTVSANVLFEAGALLQAVNNIPKAIGTWGLIVEYYPESRYAPLALFQQGIAFDNDLHDKDNAGRYYKKFLTLYPKHKLASQVEQLMKVMDKSDEELIREFEAKNKKENK